MAWMGTDINTSSMWAAMSHSLLTKFTLKTKTHLDLGQGVIKTIVCNKLQLLSTS